MQSPKPCFCRGLVTRRLAFRSLRCKPPTASRLLPSARRNPRLQGHARRSGSACGPQRASSVPDQQRRHETRFLFLTSLAPSRGASPQCGFVSSCRRHYRESSRGDSRGAMLSERRCRLPIQRMPASHFVERAANHATSAPYFTPLRRKMRAGQLVTALCRRCGLAGEKRNATFWRLATLLPCPPLVLA